MPPPMGSPTPSEDVDGHKGKGHKKGGKKGGADAVSDSRTESTLLSLSLCADLAGRLLRLRL